MAFVTEEIEVEIGDLGVVVELMTSKRDKGETRDAWRFIDLTIDSFKSLSPRELRDLGKELVKEGERIGKEYKSNGALKVTKLNGENL